MSARSRVTQGGGGHLTLWLPLTGVKKNDVIKWLKAGYTTRSRSTTVETIEQMSYLQQPMAQGVNDVIFQRTLATQWPAERIMNI